MSVYPYIIDPEVYPWSKVLKSNWETVRKEYDDFFHLIQNYNSGKKVTKVIKLDSNGEHIFIGEIFPESLTVTQINQTPVPFKLNETVLVTEVLTKANEILLIEKTQYSITAKGFENKTVIAEFAYNHLTKFSEKIYDGTWITLPIYRYGNVNQAIALHFPETLKLLQTIPGLETATYSLLEPGTHIRPHKGYSKNILRCHLGLSKKQDAYLKVGDVKLTWDEGSVFIFDDTEEHEVLHSGTVDRLSLIIDFKRDLDKEIDYPEYVKNRISEINNRR